jgi:P2 family phage contractile tail tube protein
MKKGIATQNNVFKLYDVDTGAALDGTVTVQLPAFELASNAFKGAGVGGEINVPVPGVMNALTATISVPVIYGDITKYMELGTTRTLDLRNEVIVNNKDTLATEKAPNRWVLKGQLSKSDPGKVEQGATSDGTLDMQVYYAHHWLDGDDVLEWDPFKGIYTVNGKDLMDETRRNVFVG